MGKKAYTDNAGDLRATNRFGKSRLAWTLNKLLLGAGAGADPTEIDVPNLAAHAALTTAHSAVATATADRMVVRDASARAAFAAPAAAGDALIKGTALTITEMAALTTGYIWQGVANRPVEVLPSSLGLPTIVRKTADTTISNDETLNNDPHLLLAMIANEIWYFDLILRANVRAASDFKCTFVVPAGATGGFLSPALGALDAINMLSFATALTLISVESGVTKLTILRGLVMNGATAGNLQFQWAQNAAVAENTSVMTNSFILAHKLG